MSNHKFQIEELLGALPEGGAFVSTAGQAFITLPAGQTFPLSSAYVRDWLTDQYIKRHSEFPAERAIHEAIRTLRAQAHAQPRPRPVDVRIVKSTNAIFIDLANPQGEAVQITPTNWQLSRPVEVAFRSTRGQLPLPKPELASPPPDSWLLAPDSWLLAPDSPLRQWALSALQPGPYPILVLHGPPGSGKTTAARMLRALIDPVLGPIQPLPSRGREVHELAVRDRVLVFDHVTRMSNSTADALCQVSSGIAIPIKEPGDRNREPLRLDIARPVILTTPRCGVSDWQPRPDLAERTIAVQMPKIENPRPAQEVWAEFEAARPALLATLYTALVAQVSRPVPCSPDPRSLQNLTSSSAEADPAFTAILTFAAANGEWTGTASDLPIPVPLTPRALAHRLRQLQSALQDHGVEIEFHRKHGGTREITIKQNDERTTTNDERPQNLRHPPDSPAPRLPDSQTPGLLDSLTPGAPSAPSAILDT